MRRSAGGLRRSSVFLIAVAVPAAALLVVGADTYPAVEIAPWNAEVVSAAPTGPWRAPVDVPPGISSVPGQLVSVSNWRAVQSAFQLALPVGVAPERGLQIETILAARAVSAAFPEIHNIGGVRPDALKWHPNGLAIDVMIPNYNTAEGIALGNEILSFALVNTKRFGLVHAIWRQTYYSPGSPPHLMPNLGSDDANHYTHVHIATDGGGYPTGNETYLQVPYLG